MAAIQYRKNALWARIGIIPVVYGFSRMICCAWARVAHAAASRSIVPAAARCRRSRHLARVAALAGMANSLLPGRGLVTGFVDAPGNRELPLVSGGPLVPVRSTVVRGGLRGALPGGVVVHLLGPGPAVAAAGTAVEVGGRVLHAGVVVPVGGLVGEAGAGVGFGFGPVGGAEAGQAHPAVGGD